MLEFAIGVVLGAVFAPFWMKMWNLAQSKYLEVFPPKK